jgi:hypothetical protein
MVWPTRNQLWLPSFVTRSSPDGGAFPRFPRALRVSHSYVARRCSTIRAWPQRQARILVIKTVQQSASFVESAYGRA